ncbi:putative Ig domain-containing protein [Geothrix sp. PMB-07]|uniref:beta strand repeat-containing protein n=1 Tax=Geothrix sp. PMB-07 TaxID=3068640 RepID=UPI0027407BE4|nr:putative Ig domain-containing protein [Geothrix sp. PMB-07]WLT33576.1 putative Ig domain-containing protein [Geothrix sp. PMB-07]
MKPVQTGAEPLGAWTRLRWLLCLLALLTWTACGGGGGGGSTSGGSTSPVPTVYAVTFLAGDGGSLLGATTQNPVSGASTSAVTAVPSAGYGFTNWTGTGFTASTANPLVVTGVTSNLTLTANFAPQTLTVNFQAGSGGSLSGSPTQTVAYGASTSAVTAVPAPGYTFTNWTGTGFTASTANPLVVSGVTSNLTLTANFAPQTFILNFAAGTGGSLSGSPTQTLAYGASTSSVTAVPAPGYTFLNWTGPGFTASTANPLVVSGVTSNLTLTANFAPQTFILNFAAGTGGSLTGSPTQTLAYGASTSSVTAVPALGYTFTNWTGPGFTASTANPLVISGVTSNLTLTANFAPQTFTLNFAAGTGGSLTGSPTQTLAYGASTSSVTAVPALGYTFLNWTGPGFTASTANPLVIPGVTSNLTLTANFAPQTFTVNFQAGSGGSLSGNTTQTVAYGASTSAVMAVPSPGNGFVNWAGAGFSTSTSNPLVVSGVTSDLTLTATFGALHAVTFSAGANGSLSGATSQSVLAGGDCSAVTANPNAGYALVGWTGTGGFSATTANPLTVTQVTSDMAITATFGRLPAVASFYPTASTIGKGQAAVLNWTGLNFYTSASIDNGVGAVAATSGMAVAYPTATTTYTLTATNAVGSITRAFTVTVVPPPTIQSFTAAPQAVAAGGTVHLAWSATGATSYLVENIVGPVTVVGATTATTADVVPATGSTTYRLTASNDYNAHAYASITVSSGPPVGLSYPTLAATYLRNVPITPNVPTASGGPITSYVSLPALPSLGLSLDPATGVISGTPTEVMSTNTYVIRGSNAYGMSQVTLTIGVVETPPSVTYSNASYALDLGTPVTISPVNSGGPVAAWSILPTLPAGLSFNTVTGQISGTPTAISAAATYTVTATNSGGTSAPSFSLTVSQNAPHIAYASGSYTFFKDVAITPLVPVNSGGPSSAWSVNPALPAGLNLDPSTGQISGTPTVASPAASYTISATNAGGTGATSPSLAVVVKPPVITAQPHGLILSPGDIPSFSVTATGSGGLSYQWCRNGVPIGGATNSTYTAPAFAAMDDGTAFTVVVTGGAGGSVTSAAAVVSAFQDLGGWLAAHPVVAAAVRWQIQSGDPFNYYIAPGDAQKVAWPAWSGSQQADLNQAYLDHVAWFNAGAAPVTMVAGSAPGDLALTDRPTNVYAQVGIDSNSTMLQVTPAYFWTLYTSHVAFSLMLETSHQLPWSLTDYDTDGLRWLLDSSTMGWLLPNGNVGLGTYPGANQPTLRNNNRPRTGFADPRWTYAWLRQTGILGGSRLATIGGFLDYMRQNLYHVNGGADTFGSDFAIWRYRGYSPVSQIVLGTVDTRYPAQGTQHYTEGCHGSTGFLNASLRVLNIPTQPIWICGHELIHFLSEDLYLDHADDPYNQNVRASSSPSLLLLIDSATWRSRFGSDETVNIWDYASPAGAYIGYAAAHFP